MQDDHEPASPGGCHHATGMYISRHVNLLCLVATYIFNDVAVITDKEEGAAIVQVNLHADETIRVSRQMM